MNTLFHLSVYQTNECKIQVKKEYIANGFIANHYQYSIYFCKLLFVLEIVDNKIKAKEQYTINDVDVIKFD